jgi:SAM-dependent methyltransferase
MFAKLINRSTQDTEWKKIPWHDPDFSRRMLAEHLNQVHDLASRRFRIIEQHIQWIHRKCLSARPARILDLGCGPGFYVSRLSALGHTCTGIDISPASIDHAREHDPASQYLLGDVRSLSYGEGYDLILMIYGELNAFSPQDAEHIIAKAQAALRPGGKLLLEVSPYEAIYRSGHEAPSWHTAEKGLFADEPYLCLTESRYDLDRAIQHYYVCLAASGEMHQYTAMHQAYTEDEYRRLLAEFKQVQVYPSLTGDAGAAEFLVVVAEK